SGGSRLRFATPNWHSELFRSDKVRDAKAENTIHVLYPKALPVPKLRTSFPLYHLGEKEQFSFESDTTQLQKVTAQNRQNLSQKCCHSFQVHEKSLVRNSFLKDKATAYR